MKEQFSFTGRVIEGHHLGHTLGFPTANIVVTPGEKIPALGVYAAWVTLPDGTRHAAVTNLGVRPTVEEAGALWVESYLLDFSGDLYGQELTVTLCRSAASPMWKPCGRPSPKMPGKPAPYCWAKVRKNTPPATNKPCAGPGSGGSPAGFARLRGAPCGGRPFRRPAAGGAAARSPRPAQIPRKNPLPTLTNPPLLR